MSNFDDISGFDWDKGNARKNKQHGVSQSEAEEVFFNEPFVLDQNTLHSEKESRWHALGQTSSGRRLHITFTLRSSNTLIRIISALDMSRKERSYYEEA